MAKDAAVQLGENVWRIPTMGDYINSFAFVDADGGVTLVDCGVDKAPPKIVAGLRAIGKQPQDVKRIVLTHVHPDHVGGAAELSAQTGAPVSVHDGDADAARAGRVLARPDRKYLAGRIFDRLNPGTFAAFDVGEPLVDDQLLDVAGGLRVVHTPGHSPGHVALLHEPTRLLVTGDSIFNWKRRGMRWAPKFLCTDFRLTQQTAHVLGELDYDVAAFTHGPEIRDRAREQVRGFLRDNPVPD